MKNVKYSLLAAAVGGAFALSATANAGFLSYQFDPQGTGGDNAVQVNEFLDYTGRVYVENEFTGDTTFNLQQWGYANIIETDTGASLAGDNIVARYSGGGFGDLATGRASFTDGSVELFSGGFDGTLIAEFEIIGGGSTALDDFGAPNGASTLDARATFFESGFFFKDGQDFAEADLEEDNFFGFATNNLSFIENQDTIDTVQGNLDGAFPGNEFSGTNQTVSEEDDRLTNLYAGANGQFRVAAVPEPGMLALAGAGLLGLGFAMRRRRDS